ncbi:ABC transporter substrate-binding protein [Empedobacter falsenii]|uniref:ABC transporter substrate-binding protein n=1 Tax=Empedobacter falsenii TaxID=343874 RepID=UPI003A7FB64F
MIKKFILTSFVLLAISSCKQSKEAVKTEQENTTFQFAKNISIEENNETITIKSSGNTISFDKKDLPIKTVMVETSSAVTFLDQLGSLDLIKGVCDADFIYNPKIAEGIANKSILKVGNSNELFTEIILKNKPQLIIASSNPVLAKFHQQLEQNGIKVLYLDEYKEQNPLGQVEYLKVFGKLFGKDTEAEKRVETVKNNYDSIKNIIQTKGQGNVSTIVNTMYGDIWYVPTNDLLQAKLIDDAKGNYIFKNKTGENSLSLTFEEVYTAGKSANYWINVTNVNTLAEMKASYPNYAWFDAFKKGNVYAYNKRMNAKGSNDYFEQGIIRPDIILNDLGKIFYPNLFPTYELYFYQQLK